MMQIDRPKEETEELVRSAMRDAGIASTGIKRDDRGRIKGVKRAFSATGIVRVDIATLPERSDTCYVSVVGHYNSRSQVPHLLGRKSPKITEKFRSELRAKGGDDLTVL